MNIHDKYQSPSVYHSNAMACLIIFNSRPNTKTIIDLDMECFKTIYHDTKGVVEIQSCHSVHTQQLLAHVDYILPHK
jgi:hypothetical protein